MVTKPQNVMVMRDVACAGYVAGGNVRWFARDENGNFSAQTARDNIQSRLSFDDDMTDRYASMLAFPAWEGQFENSQLDTVMSVTTRLLPWEVNGAQFHNSFPGGEEMFKAYSALLNLQQVHYGEDMKAAENQDFISQVNVATFEPFFFPCARTRFAHPCLAVLWAGLDQQRHVLPRTAPQVRPVHQELHVAHPGPGPLWPRRHSWSKRCTHFNAFLAPRPLPPP